MRITESSIVLNFEGSSGGLRRPRLGLLLVGLSCIVIAVVIWLRPWALPFGEGLTAIEVLCLSGFFVMAGALLSLQAIFRDLTSIHSIRISDVGLAIQWSHVPHLLGARLHHTDELTWSDIEHVEWEEGIQEYDFKQHLAFELKSPLKRRLRSFRVLVCKDCDFYLCEKLLNLIPHQLKAPGWFARTKARQQVNFYQ